MGAQLPPSWRTRYRLLGRRLLFLTVTLTRRHEGFHIAGQAVEARSSVAETIPPRVLSVVISRKAGFLRYICAGCGRTGPRSCEIGPVSAPRARAPRASSANANPPGSILRAPLTLHEASVGTDLKRKPLDWAAICQFQAIAVTFCRADRLDPMGVASPAEIEVRQANTCLRSARSNEASGHRSPFLSPSDGL
jgi:hypothetical protein